MKTQNVWAITKQIFRRAVTHVNSLSGNNKVEKKYAQHPTQDVIEKNIKTKKKKEYKKGYKEKQNNNFLTCRKLIRIKFCF